MEPVRAPCHSKRARWDSGPREASAIKHVVIHSTEGGTAAGVAADFATRPRATGASTQLVVDDKECWRMLPDLVVPWGAPGVNETGLHIEHCGFARWSRAEWLAHEKMLRRSAWKAAKWCHHYGIPRRWIGRFRRWIGLKGFVTHKDASVAFMTPGGHTDPGPGFPRDVYMRFVKTYYAELAKV